MESDALKRLAESLDSQFDAAVHCLLDCRGRIVITGVGKSAIIGIKMVATFNSIGVPSLFLHASDALHGDLGVVQPEDVLICISKSGETEEIRALVAAVRSKTNSIISLVSDPHSFLGKNSDITVQLPEQSEADPFNLVPSTSTIMQMSLGDALAVVLMHLKNFKPENFATFHPGGMLGKKLNLKVKDLCNTHLPPSVSLDSTIEEVLIEISSKRLGMTVVTSGDGSISGIITDGDLRRMLESNEDHKMLYAADIMTTKPHTISPDAMATRALAKMRHHQITQLPVVQDNEYIGVIHIHDLLREGF